MLWWLAIPLAGAADLIVDGTVVNLSGAWVYDDVQVINGGMILVDPYNGITGGSLVIEADSILVDAASSIVADGAGYRGGALNAVGEGPGGGLDTGDNGGGGGGHGGPGGDGLDDVYAACAPYDVNGGATYDTTVPSTTAELGSGGAGGDGNGTGGSGGGAIALFAPIVQIDGVLSVNGADGVGGANDAGGAGSGGAILLAGDTLICLGTLSAQGGYGTIPVNLTDGGGGGGGGVVEQYFNLAGTPCVTVDVDPGYDRCGSTGGATAGVVTAIDPGDTFFDWDLDGVLGPDCDVHDASVGGPTPWFADLDGDGWGDGPSVDACLQPANTAALAGDCADGDPNVNPAAAEVAADGTDANCDGLESCYADTDGDGVGSAAWVDSGDLDCDDPGESWLATDCAPTDPDVFPGATETVADGVDQDCDGIEACYVDGDLDGFGDAIAAAGIDVDCDDPGEAWVGGDCDDANAALNPGMAEVTGDEVDQDCDGHEACYTDGDLDGAGGLGVALSADADCADPGEATSSADCADNDAAIYPAALELPGDEADQNCDGAELCFRDADLDGSGGMLTVASGDLDCQDANESVSNRDCNDFDAATYPSAAEVVGDEVDQDCDGGEACFTDSDSDGYGVLPVVASPDVTCDAVDGESPTDDDCDDGDATINPGAAEIPSDGIDQTCDGVDGCFADGDGDGFGTPQPVASADADCTDPGESDNDTDCDDAHSAIYPGAAEGIADSIDQDCDGAEICWRDGDDDTFGTATEQPSADVDCDDAFEADDVEDCLDTDVTVNPGAAEIPDDGIDQDCDGFDAIVPIDTGDTAVDTGTRVTDTDAPPLPSVDDRVATTRDPVGSGCGCGQSAPRSAWIAALGLWLTTVRRTPRAGTPRAPGANKTSG